MLWHQTCRRLATLLLLLRLLTAPLHTWVSCRRERTQLTRTSADIFRWVRQPAVHILPASPLCAFWVLPVCLPLNACLYLPLCHRLVPMLVFVVVPFMELLLPVRAPSRPALNLEAVAATAATPAGPGNPAPIVAACPRPACGATRLTHGPSQH